MVRFVDWDPLAGVILVAGIIGVVALALNI
jgi:hypothetical protein